MNSVLIIDASSIVLQDAVAMLRRSGH